jgi:hypothetical protein
MAISSTQCGLYTPNQFTRQAYLLHTNQPVAEKNADATTLTLNDDQKPTSTKKSTPGQHPLQVEQTFRPPSVRSSFSLDPTRELKAIHVDPKQTLATKTFLDIAHYEENFHLVDIFA